MKIEIAKAERMSQSGSSLLRLIQNNNMPILDLFVRESVQNSLDAGIDGEDYVNLHFMTGDFDGDAFSDELEGISDKLKVRYSNEKNRFLAVRDSKTNGLTGPMNYESVENNHYGNLLKLVYEISKPQEKAGAGGSWGLGKTVYFRVGMGLVVYYSRIKTPNGFQSRMAVTLVENETASDVLIPKEETGLSRGIAWWGRETGENKTEPLTDVYEINRILSEFNIQTYTGDETGTTVIIPFIDEEALLKNNEVVYELPNGNGEYTPAWRRSVERYLEVALQRWYAPRINNPLYPYGKYLRAMVNNKGISYDYMEPFFKVIQLLYNRANGHVSKDDFLLKNKENTGIEEIKLRGVFQSTDAGTLAYTQIDSESLGMGYPDNRPSPYVYANIEISNREGNAPIICFTRMPGMVVSYENTGKWADGIPVSGDSNHYLIAIFVLNSRQKFKKMDYTLEEYARKSEMADHTDWNDWSMDAYNPRIITKIQSHIASKMSRQFGIVEDQKNVTRNSGLGKLFGEMLLPPQNFGRKASASGKKNRSNTAMLSRHKNANLSIKKDFSYELDNTMRIHLILKEKEKMKSAAVMLGINSETGVIKTDYWQKKMGLELPFYIERADIIFAKDKKYHDQSDEIIIDAEHEENTDENNNVRMILADGKGIGILFEKKGKDQMDAQITITLKIISREAASTFYLDEEAEK